jgi:ParB family chromosome partitioning protein
MAAEGRRRNLGRGLSALLGEDDETGGGEAARGLRTLPVEFLHPSPFQPRHRMNDERLQELAQSIADKGVLQPLLVRRDSGRVDSYEIIAGERRWRAAQLAQVHEVPVIVREMEDREALEIALIENLQREDLSALDEADGYRRLKDEFSYTQAELATALGKSRSHVANTLRLLNLPDAVKEMIETSALTAGHARALLNATDPVSLARTVARRGLNVRQTEKLVQSETRPARTRKTAGRDPDTVALERDLSNLLGLRVGIQFRGGAGSLTIHYQSLEQLDEILHRLSRGATGSHGALPPDQVENDDTPSDFPADDPFAIEEAPAAPADEGDPLASEEPGDEAWPAAGPDGDEGDLPAFPAEHPQDKS